MSIKDIVDKAIDLTFCPHASLVNILISHQNYVTLQPVLKIML